MKIRKSYRVLALMMLGPLLLGASDRETALMDEIEQTVKLPPGASSLWVYVRKYTYMADKTVTGVYVNQIIADEVPSRAWVHKGQMPKISGVGCGAVTVWYDPAKKSPPEAMCNP